MAQADTQTSDNQLYLDDLVVGQRFTSRTHVIDATEIKAFARQFDPQPFHLDEETAKRAFFGELVASGWHTAAITMRLLVETGLPLAGGIIGAGGEVSWPKPTRPGDTLAVASEIEEITPSRSRALPQPRATTALQRDAAQSAWREGLGREWERGEKRPSGPSLKLLSIVKTKGLDVIT